MSENTKRVDLKITGSGTVPGGVYNLIRITGSGRISGDVECSDFIINGSGELNGSIKNELIKINGAGRISGDVDTKELKVSGTANFDSAVVSENVSVSGSADIAKDLSAKKININGSLKAAGCNADEILSNGTFEIDGLLSADNIEVRLSLHKSRAKEIGGEKITVSLGKGGFGVLTSIFSLGAHTPRLEVGTIEGNEITLENTVAKIVRGNNISLGSGCNIGLVEYKGTLSQS